MDIPIWVFIWAIYTAFIVGYWIGRYHEYKINKREKELTTFEFENKDEQ